MGSPAAVLPPLRRTTGESALEHSLIQNPNPKPNESSYLRAVAGLNYSATRNFLLLFSVPPGVVTTTGPVVAPVGTVAVISELDTTVNAAAVPLNVTLVAPVRLVPRMTT